MVLPLREFSMTLCAHQPEENRAKLFPLLGANFWLRSRKARVKIGFSTTRLRPIVFPLMQANAWC